MVFLTGEYDHQIDAKNRIRVPSKLKGDKDKLYFTKGTNGCIFAFYEEILLEKLAKLEEIAMGDPQKQKGVRAFTKSVRQVDVDNQGRLMVPLELRSYAQLKKDVKICGAGSHIEIWAKEVFDEYYGDDDTNFDELFNSLGI